MTITEKIARAYAESGLSQDDFARRHGISQNRVSDIVQKDWLPTTPVLRAFVKAAGWSFDWAMDDSKDWPPVMADQKGVVLSPAEATVLDIARRISRKDADPSALLKAIDRLEWNVEDEARVVAAALPRSISPANVEDFPNARPAGEGPRGNSNRTGHRSNG